MNLIPKPEATELTGKEASTAWNAWSDTIPGHWNLVPMEQDEWSKKLEKAGFASHWADPTKEKK